MKLTLYRYREDSFGTHGQIENESGTVLCFTIERPWLNNMHDVSCIPVGIYNCKPHVKTNNGQRCFILNNVPGRTGILIHCGNTEKDSEGCIIVGMSTNAEGVLESQTALQNLLNKVPLAFTLEITSTFN